MTGMMDNGLKVKGMALAIGIHTEAKFMMGSGTEAKPVAMVSCTGQMATDTKVGGSSARSMEKVTIIMQMARNSLVYTMKDCQQVMVSIIGQMKSHFTEENLCKGKSKAKAFYSRSFIKKHPKKKAGYYMKESFSRIINMAMGSLNGLMGMYIKAIL